MMKKKKMMMMTLGRMILCAPLVLQPLIPTANPLEDLAQELAGAQNRAIVTEAHFRVLRADGGASTLADIVKVMADYDAVLIGETHDDPVAHSLEAELLQLAYQAHTARRPLVLSLEMFERDVQTVLDEYLGGLIPEEHFLKTARPWRNYAGDYKPLIEFAKTKQLPVIAANAPRRYVNRVSRLGKASLDNLSPQAKAWLPPLSYGEVSAAYAEKFRAAMSSVRRDTSGGAAPSAASQERAVNTLAAQSLWDASMAEAVSEQLKRRKNALVLHINGSFHSEERMGIPEHLSRYHAQARVLVVTLRSIKSFPEFDAKEHVKYGDFVILTDGKLPRTYMAEEPSRNK